MTPEEIDKWLIEELGDWTANAIQLLQSNIVKQDLVLDEKLLNSFKYQVVKGTGDVVAETRLAFNNYGRILEMKNLFYSKMPPIKAFEEFVQKVGIEKFKYVPGYKNKDRIPSESIAVKRIAWAIARSRLKQKFGKPKRWYARSFWGQIEKLIQTLLKGYKESISTVITEELQKGLN